MGFGKSLNKSRKPSPDKLMSYKIAIFLSILFFTIGLVTLKDYGINWDTINHLPRGQAYLNFLLFGKKDFSNIPKFLQGWQTPGKWYTQNPQSLGIDTNITGNNFPRRSLYQVDGQGFEYYINNDGDGHPPTSDILSSAFNLVLFQKLGWINDIDSYHVYGIVLAAALVGLIFFWVSKLYGNFAGLISSISLIIYPLFFAEAHFNTEKDIPETVYWAFLMFSVWKGITEKSRRWLLASGVFFGLALGTKFNILFAGPIILIWVIVYLLNQFWVNQKKSLNINSFVDYFKKFWKLILAGLTAPIIGLGIFVGTWPYLWTNTFEGFKKVFGFYKTIGTSTSVDSRFIWHFGLDILPSKWILYTTPLVILFLFTLGIIFVVKNFKNEKDKVSLLFALWFIVPIARVTFPGTEIYGGVRQIMEYIPAMAVFAGVGALFLRNLLTKLFLKLNLNKKDAAIISMILIVSLFTPIITRLISIHPNENVYFNQLIGGLSGAKAKDFPFWGDSFGNAYRQGAVWLNANAEPGADVAFAYELIPNLPRIWLRTDLNLVNKNRSGYLRRGEYLITLTYQGTEGRSYLDMYLNKFEEPVYQVKVDNVSILKIWKNDDHHLKLHPTEKILENPIVTHEPWGVRIDTGQIVKLNRLEINYTDNNCQKLITGYDQFSADGKNWTRLPGTFPDDWRISLLGEQPSKGHFIEPFVGQEARYIDLSFTPADTCVLKNIQDLKLYTFE